MYQRDNNPNKGRKKANNGSWVQHENSEPRGVLQLASEHACFKVTEHACLGISDRKHACEG